MASNGQKLQLAAPDLQTSHSGSKGPDNENYMAEAALDDSFNQLLDDLSDESSLQQLYDLVQHQSSILADLTQRLQTEHLVAGNLKGHNADHVSTRDNAAPAPCTGCPASTMQGDSTAPMQQPMHATGAGPMQQGAAGSMHVDPVRHANRHMMTSSRLKGEGAGYKKLEANLLLHRNSSSERVARAGVRVAWQPCTQQCHYMHHGTSHICMVHHA